MNKDKDIRPINAKGQLHGYQQWYSNNNNKITLRGNSKNNMDVGYQEYHGLKKTNLYIR